MVVEKRNSPRQTHQGQVHVDILKASNENIKASVRYEGAMKDISLNGIRLHGMHPLQKHAIVEMLVEFEDNHKQYNLSASVVWVTKTTEHEYIAGLSLTQDSSKDFNLWKKLFL